MISQDVLAILSCPITGQSMRGMTPDELETLNARISAGGVCFRDGNPLKHLLTAAVVNESGVLAYIARDSIFSCSPSTRSTLRRTPSRRWQQPKIRSWIFTTKPGGTK
jgi:hypothetical protein